MKNHGEFFWQTRKFRFDFFFVFFFSILTSFQLFAPKKGSSDCHYKVLGVAEGATPYQIRKAYLEKAKSWHPDIWNRANPTATQEQKDETVERFKAIGEAWSVLSDPVKRDNYNRGYDESSASDNSFDDVNVGLESFERFFSGKRRSDVGPELYKIFNQCADAEGFRCPRTDNIFTFIGKNIFSLSFAESVFLITHPRYFFDYCCCGDFVFLRPEISDQVKDLRKSLLSKVKEGMKSDLDSNTFWIKNNLKKPEDIVFLDIDEEKEMKVINTFIDDFNNIRRSGVGINEHFLPRVIANKMDGIGLKIGSSLSACVWIMAWAVALFEVISYRLNKNPKTKRRIKKVKMEYKDFAKKASIAFGVGLGSLCSFCIFSYYLGKRKPNIFYDYDILNSEKPKNDDSKPKPKPVPGLGWP